jgi:D-beta-D-heptose 7-phosphate kinase/D-beta-D-heptose 1-phosphate adenosyltransferase
VIVLCSGGFDPLHVGHLDLIYGAADLGRVVVALNSDAWLVRKKGFAFMPYAERCRILYALAVPVHLVVAVDDADGTVCDAIRRIRPHYFANGGDRTQGEPAEHALCVELGVQELFGIGGEKVQSSSALVDAAFRAPYG